MKQIIKKSIVFITAAAIMLTLAMPMSAEAASKKGKGVAVITVKVKGSKTLRCKVTVKDNRKPVTKKPITNPEPSPAPKPDDECEHDWVQKEKVVGTKLTCSCGLTFNTAEEHTLHCDERMEQGLESCGVSSTEIYETYYECSKCHKTK